MPLHPASLPLPLEMPRTIFAAKKTVMHVAQRIEARVMMLRMAMIENVAVF